MKKRYLAVMAATMTTMAVTACSGNQTTTETTAVETTTAAASAVTTATETSAAETTNLNCYLLRTAKKFWSRALKLFVWFCVMPILVIYL